MNRKQEQNIKECTICNRRTSMILKRDENCGDTNYFCDKCDPGEFTCGISNSCIDCEALTYGD